jgi:hypothetical protein
MYRLFAQVLILSLFTLNVGWAADACQFTGPGKVESALLQSDNISPEFPEAGIDCDDWCYAWVGPVALTRNDVVNITVSTSIISFASRTLSYSSLAIPPPYHPPIA